MRFQLGNLFGNTKRVTTWYWCIRFSMRQWVWEYERLHNSTLTYPFAIRQFVLARLTVQNHTWTLWHQITPRSFPTLARECPKSVGIMGRNQKTQFSLRGESLRCSSWVFVMKREQKLHLQNLPCQEEIPGIRHMEAHGVWPAWKWWEDMGRPENLIPSTGLSTFSPWQLCGGIRQFHIDSYTSTAWKWCFTLSNYVIILMLRGMNYDIQTQSRQSYRPNPSKHPQIHQLLDPEATTIAQELGMFFPAAQRCLGGPWPGPKQIFEVQVGGQGGFQKWGYPKSMVSSGKYHSKLDDLGLPVFHETSKSTFHHSYKVVPHS